MKKKSTSRRRSFVVDLAGVRSAARLHAALVAQLPLPQHYGRNLDALWDCISTMEAQVILSGKDAMIDNLGSYGESLYRTLCEAAVRNPHFELTCVN